MIEYNVCFEENGDPIIFEVMWNNNMKAVQICKNDKEVCLSWYGRSFPPFWINNEFFAENYVKKID